VGCRTLISAGTKQDLIDRRHLLPDSASTGREEEGQRAFPAIRGGPMPETTVTTETAETEQPETESEMCCDGQKTAEQHRRESKDGKCCIDE
jgi:hypothetical protein